MGGLGVGTGAAGGEASSGTSRLAWSRSQLTSLSRLLLWVVCMAYSMCLLGNPISMICETRGVGAGVVEEDGC